MKTDLSFQQAKEALQAFLARENRPHVVHWVFREDLLAYRRNILLRWPLPADNEHYAEDLFRHGKEKGLGLALEVCGFDQTNAYAYVLVPEDEADSEVRMMAPLKLKYFTDDLKIIKIKPAFVWWLVKSWLSNSSSTMLVDSLPVRKRS